MSFFPSEYKEVPQNPSGYMKLKQGANKFRILSSAIVGYEYWNTENKPVRQKDKFKTLPTDIKLDAQGMPTRIRHFWAFVVWNYVESLVQILEITQSSIQTSMKFKIDNREGKAQDNDWIITRNGEGLDTDYDVDVLSPTPLEPKITEAYMSKKINLEALYEGKDPFAS